MEHDNLCLMPSLTEFRVVIKSRNNRDLPETKGVIYQATWSLAERRKNGLRIFGILMMCAFCSILIHFGSIILVPTFLFSSFYFGFEKYNEIETNHGGTGECTKCHQPLVIVKSKMKSRLTDTCGKCFEELELTPEMIK